MLLNKTVRLIVKTGDKLVLEYDNGFEQEVIAEYPFETMTIPRDCNTLVRNDTVLYYRYSIEQ